MNKLQKIGFASLSVIVGIEQSFAAINFGGDKVQQNVQGSTNTAENTVQNLIGNAMMFIGILAVIYGIYGGFLVMTAGTNEGNVKKGKQILIYAGVGIIIIFLANSIVQFILTKLLTNA